MKLIHLTFIIMALSLVCNSQVYIAGHEIAKESVLRSIPVDYIYKARTQFHVAYQHTSHGTHVSRGVFGLQDYKAGDDTLFAVTNNNPTLNKLDFRDYAIEGYAAPGDDAADLSRNETAFIQATRNYLDDPENAVINVIMWSWCDIAGHDVSGNYLPGMATLISEYGVGGSKIGTGDGKRAKPVHFIFMTGHANYNDNVGTGKPKDQEELINNYCNTNQYFCLDYYSIDAHDMEGNFWEDAGDDGDSPTGGNFYQDWQDAHTLGVHYFENKSSPKGSVAFGDHNSQHITANRKGMAFWWFLARLAGWDGANGPTAVPGIYDNTNTSGRPDYLLYPNPCSDKAYFNFDHTPANTIVIVNILTLNGRVAISRKVNLTDKFIDVSGLSPGIYMVTFHQGRNIYYQKLIKK